MTNILVMSGYIRKLKILFGNVGATLKRNGVGLAVVACLLTEDIVLLVDNKGNFRDW